MDYQNRVGSKKGAGGLAGDAETNQYRQERVKSLLLSNTNIESDPYIFKNHLGILECKLCLTTHMNETSYLTHRTGRRHVVNLMRRSEADERKQKEKLNQGSSTNDQSNVVKRKWEPIGKPEYKVIKIKDEVTNLKGLRLEVKLPSVKNDVVPMFRLMSCFEQKVDAERDSNFQYIVVSAEPYSNIGFKVPGNVIDLSNGRMWDYFDQNSRMYYIQLFYLE